MATLNIGPQLFIGPNHNQLFSCRRCPIVNLTLEETILHVCDAPSDNWNEIPLNAIDRLADQNQIIREDQQELIASLNAIMFCPFRTIRRMVNDRVFDPQVELGPPMHPPLLPPVWIPVPVIPPDIPRWLLSLFNGPNIDNQFSCKRCNEQQLTFHGAVSHRCFEPVDNWNDTELKGIAHEVRLEHITDPIHEEIIQACTVVLGCPAHRIREIVEGGQLEGYLALVPANNLILHVDPNQVADEIGNQPPEQAGNINVPPPQQLAAVQVVVENWNYRVFFSVIIAVTLLMVMVGLLLCEGRDEVWAPYDPLRAINFAINMGSAAVAMREARQKVKVFSMGRDVLDPIEVDMKTGAGLNFISFHVEYLIFIHGYTSNGLGFFSTFVNGSNVVPYTTNCLTVDWEELAAGMYGSAVRNVPVVGKIVGEFLLALIHKGILHERSLHLVCHSLGCQVTNFIAKELPYGKIGKISALDPAFPIFDQMSDEYRLDKSDAELVTVLHTSGGSVWKGGLGFPYSRGHCDYYANNGLNQPECGIEFVKVCSHSRANKIFAETMESPKKHVACYCHKILSTDDCDCSLIDGVGYSAKCRIPGAYRFSTQSGAQ